MNNRKRFVVIGLTATLALVCGVMGWVVLKRPTAGLEAAKAPRETALPRAKTTAASATPKPRSTMQTQNAVKVNTGSRPAKKLILDPAARTALKLVGSDPDAERYWIGAINNPFLPPDERSDPIEDLNEDGLSDPKNPGVIDLPLIATRIRLIEELMPDALDRVNADAFKEAHKDLVNMQAKLNRR